MLQTILKQKVRLVMILKSSLQLNDKPICKLNTSTQTVYKLIPDSLAYETFTFNSDCIKYHLSHMISQNRSRLQNLVDKNEIYEYLYNLEAKVSTAIFNQVEKWKQSDKEYIIAIEKGDIQKAAGLENCLNYMASEMIFDCMVYL